MKQNQSFFRRAADFAQDRGFYIILGLCAVAIGISGYVLFFTGNDTNDIPEPQTTVSAPNEIEVPDPGPVQQPDVQEQPSTDVANEPEVPEVPETPPEPETPAETETPDSTESDPPAQTTNNPVNVPAEQSTFTLPVDGEVLRAFSGQELIYDETMADWRVHGGTDFSCTEGEQVLAVADGEVSAIYTDEMWGNCVSIQHSDGLVTTYCGLVENATLTTGMAVRSGDVIGGAGGGIACESTMPAHIHVVATRNGESIDLMSLFTE